MVKKLLPCLAFICVLGLATCLSAQDDAKETEKTETTQQTRKAKGTQKKITQFSKKISRELKVELTEDQQKKLSELIEAKLDGLNDINKQVQGIITKENRKTINQDIKKARDAGKPWPEASKIAWDNAGISAEDQTKLKELNKERNEITASVKKEIVATFSDEQKKAFKDSSKKKRKGKGKKKKKEADDETTSVSISLPGMT